MDEAQDLKTSPPLLSVLQPKTEVRSQVNIPPSRCLQRASGQDKTRPAMTPYLHTPRALPPAPTPQLLSFNKLSAQLNRQSKANDISQPGGRPFFLKGQQGNLTLLSLIPSQTCHVTSCSGRKNSGKLSRNN